jgi:hypothetical protein
MLGRKNDGQYNNSIVARLAECKFNNLTHQRKIFNVNFHPKKK